MPLVLAIGGTVVHADKMSHTGTLASPEDFVEFVVTLPATGILGLQTYGFGGGTNAAGTVILPGGFDPFVSNNYRVLPISAGRAPSSPPICVKRVVQFQTMTDRLKNRL